MNDSSIPRAVLDKVIQSRGRLHVVEELEPRKTALVVIDMQNFFVEEGQPLEVPAAREIVPNINRLAGKLRETCGTVVWVQVTLSEDVFAEWSIFLDYRNEQGREMFSGLRAGEHGQALWHKLEVHAEYLVLDKTRFSAFIQGASHLDQILRDKGIDTLLITGTLTNVCCESTARDAMMLNYRVVMVSDASAALTDSAHQASLANMISFFGDVYTADETIALLAAAKWGIARGA